ncbi:LuxR C-terminal-related transcriptional regulator [Streptomyces sp. NPDC020681]|uniref:helix-turn-helix transcriptional regulator n=1 Tax=Streptomyces sp. NPDC020681 TaxID=3365083 RepID=UPI0037B22D4C
MKKELTNQSAYMGADAVRTVTVRIHADDTLTQAGLSHCLARFRGLVEIDPDAPQEPDVVVVGVVGAGSTTLELLQTLSPSGTGRFVLVVDEGWDASVSSAVELGVRAILWRSRFSTAQFARAVIAVAEGEGILPSSLQGSLMREIQHMQREMLASRGITASGFSTREIDVLRLLAEGMDLEKVSEALSYSERTIKNILYGAMKRHKLRNRTHAVSHAIRSGLI